MNIYFIGILITIAYIILLIFSNKNYEKLVVLNVFLLSFALVEPSPSDFLFIIIVIFYFKNNEINLNCLKKNNLFAIPIFLYLIINLLSIYNVEDYFTSLKFIAITIYLVFYSIFLLIYFLNFNEKKVIRAYLYGSTFSAILGILGYIGFLPYILRYDNFRVKSLFKDPNVFGPFLVPSIIILLDYIINEKEFKKIYLYTLLILLNIIGVVISFSRGAWINLIIATTIYLFLNIKRIKLKVVIKYLALIAIIIFILWFFVLTPEFKHFLLERANIQDYDTNRFTAQKSGLNQMYNKIFGYGPGQYENAVVKEINSNTSAHSLYMRVLLENGFIGFCLFIFAFIYIIIELFIVHLRKMNNKIIKSSVLISIIFGLLVNSLVVDTLHWRHLWFFVGVSLYTITSKNVSWGDKHEY